MANSFENKTFLFTGKLKNMKREEAEAKVAALGGKAVSDVSKNLSVLVATSDTSAKCTKAQELNSKGANIQLWTEEQFMAELDKARLRLPFHRLQLRPQRSAQARYSYLRFRRPNHVDIRHIHRRQRQKRLERSIMAAETCGQNVLIK